MIVQEISYHYAHNIMNEKLHVIIYSVTKVSNRDIIQIYMYINCNHTVNISRLNRCIIFQNSIINICLKC